MAQAGIHSLVGVTLRRWTPDRKLLILGIVLGTLLPDTDNLAVAVATVTGGSTEGLHRTFTHSIFTIIALILLFQLLATLMKRPSLTNLGIGIGIGMLTHIVIDLIIWFNGVQLLWPLPLYVNFWQNVTLPEWFSLFLMPAEMLCFALYFWGLSTLARKQGTNLDQLKSLRIWTAVQLILFLILTILVYTLDSGFLTIYGALYLLSLGVAIVITIKMRQTLEMTAEMTPVSTPI